MSRIGENVRTAGPLVSVVMPFRNAETYITGALASIVRQTYENLEIIVIDDGSSGRELDLVRQFSDGRIKIVGDKRHLGITRRLNQGIEIACGKYIARMDADDLAAPTRIERQVLRMEEDPTIAVIGTRAVYIDAFDKLTGFPRPPPEENYQIKWRFLTSTCLVHPTVMLRSSVAKSHRYSESFPFAQDYELWLRLAVAGYRFANIPEVLLLLRRHADAASFSSRKKQLECASEALEGYLASQFNLKASRSSVTGMIQPPAYFSNVDDRQESPVIILKTLAETVAPTTAKTGKECFQFVHGDLVVFAARYIFRLFPDLWRSSSRVDYRGLRAAIFVICTNIGLLLKEARDYLKARRQCVREGKKLVSVIGAEKLSMQRGSPVL